MITIDDLIKYGFARDVEPLKSKSLEERNKYYDKRIANTRKSLEDQRPMFERARWSAKEIESAEKSAEKLISQHERDRESALKIVEERFASEARQYERFLQNPSIIRQIGEKKVEEIKTESDRTSREAEGVRRQTEKLKEQARAEAETFQRKGAERQAGRVRARSGRGASRQMLASVRLSPQPMGVGGKSTLGEAPF